MAAFFDNLRNEHQRFIEAQHLFFCATAADEGRINLSPKGMDSLRVMDPARIVWRNLTGSGNETAAHVAASNRMTLMWCGFEQRAMILRVYGSARILHPRDAAFAALNDLFPHSNGARQIFDFTVESVQTSCGWAIPVYQYQAPRNILADWAERKGPEGIAKQWEKNAVSIDGLPTHIFDEPAD